MKIKGYTLAEVTVALMIMGIICMLMLNSFKSKDYKEETNKILAKKTISQFEQATTDMINKNKDNFPAGSWMVKVPGASDYIFAVKKSGSSTDASATDIINLYENYLKYETSVINFCDYSDVCTSSEIKGARLAGGVYFGIEKTDIEDCPAYRLFEENRIYETPKKYNIKTKEYEPKKCWGKLYIDVNGSDIPNIEGEDIFVFGMGEYGIERSSDDYATEDN